MVMYEASVQKKLDILIGLCEGIFYNDEQAIQLARSFETCRKKWRNTEEELVENQNRLAKVEIELTALTVRFKHACSQLDVELRRRQKADLACEQLERRLHLVHDVLKSDVSSRALQNEDQRSLLQALTGHTGPEGKTGARLRTVDETMTSNFSCSSISYDRTCDEDSDTGEQIPEDCIVGNQLTLVTDPEFPEAPSPDPFTTPGNTAQARPHIFVSKTIIMPEVCVPCGKRIRFGRMALKCRRCNVVTHPDCKDRCPPICAPNFTVTSVKNGQGTVADFAPLTVPMIPSLVIHCANEIEQRGLQEPGIYRVPGGERMVRELKENYVRGKGLPLLSRVTNIHVVCGLLKDFLRKLKEPLVTFKLHSTFMALTDLPDDESVRNLSRAVHRLPRANRDTLAFLIVHLQRVMVSPECKMDKQSIARIFGPTIVGHSNPNPNPLEVFEDTKRQPKIVENLLSLSSDYWNQMVGEETAQTGSSSAESGLVLSGNLFKPLTSPEVAEMLKRSPRCCIHPAFLAMSGKIFPSPTLQ
ncbi:rac GTPase-activating protein 1-like [Scyliorhinus torazame]